MNVRLLRHVLVGSAAYLFVWVLLASGFLPPLAAALLAAPFVLLVPAGVGLLAFFGWRGAIAEGIGRVQALLAAWLFGTLAMIYVFVLLERSGLTGRFADSVLTLSFLLSAGGWLRLRGQFTPSLNDLYMLRLVALVTLPLVMVNYIANISVYSEFPVMDLFQRTHFHKGALEFAKFDILNPFVADSYIPFQPLLLGLMGRGAHVDPIVAEWVLPVVLAPLQVGAIFVVACCFTKTRLQLALAIGLFLAMSTVTNLTNGDLASVAGLLLMSFLLEPADEHKEGSEKGAGVLFLLASIVGAIFFVKLPVHVALVVLLAAGLLVSMPVLDAKHTRATVIAILIFAAISFHRAGLLFVGLVVVIYFAVTFYAWMLRKGAFRLLAINFLALLLLCAVMAGWILIQEGKHPRDEFGLWAIFDFVLLPLAGKSMTLVTIDNDLAQGAGGRISLFEVVRSLSMVGLLVSVLAFMRAIWPAIVGRNAKQGEANPEAGSIVPTIVCLLLLVVTLTGFPFVHRSAFLIVTLLSIALAVFVAPSSEETTPVGRLVIAGSIGLVGYMCVLLALLLLVHDPRIEPFLDRVFLLLFLLFAVGVAIAAWCILDRRRIWLGTVLVLSVLFEVQASHAYFKRYAFMNQTPTRDAVVSHFGHRELATADSIALKLDPGTLLASDPKTMALLGMRSGLNPLISFSNLNTMPDEVRKKLVGLLRTVAAGAPVSRICLELGGVSSSHQSSQMNYVRLRRLGLSGRESLDVLHYNDAVVARSVARSVAPPVITESTTLRGQLIAILISPDTVDWLTHPFDYLYFPARRDMSEIAYAFRSYGAMGSRVGDVFMLLVRCE